MPRASASKAQSNFAEIVQRATHKKQRIVVSRRGKEVAAVIPIEDLRLFERLLEEREDREDVQEAERRLADPAEAPISYEKPSTRAATAPVATSAMRPTSRATVFQMINGLRLITSEDNKQTIATSSAINRAGTTQMLRSTQKYADEKAAPSGNHSRLIP